MPENSEMMTQVAVTGKHEFTASRVVIPEPRCDEVQIKIAYCGICGSDIPRYFEGKVHSFPQVLGHEFSGIISALGTQVEGLQLGQRVAVAPLVPCATCDICSTENPALCKNYSFIGSRQPGALAEYVVAPARNIVPVGDLSLKTAALTEPLTVAIHAINHCRSDIKSATILGSGVIGLMTLIALRARGVEDITMVDVHSWPLDVAQKFGARHTINSATDDLDDHYSRHGAPDLCVETAGASATRIQALKYVRRGGEIVLVGTPSSELTLSVTEYEYILRKELTIHGSWMSYSLPFPGKEWDSAVQLLREIDEDSSDLITHTFPLSDVDEAFETLKDSSQHRLKIMLRCSQEEQ